MFSSRLPCCAFRPVEVFLASCLVAALAAGTALVASTSRLSADLSAERSIAAAVSEKRMVETVRTLVGFGARMAGTPSNHEAAKWLAEAFREAGLEVTVRNDQPRDWYQPVSWEVRVPSGSKDGAAVLRTAWPAIGSPSAKGEGRLALEAAPGAVCLAQKNPTPESAAGCSAVLFDGRSAPSGWPTITRLRGAGWTIPVFAVSPNETKPLRDRLARGENLTVSFTLEARSGKDSPHTVVATLRGKDRSRHVLFCAHGDSDSGGPGANDNASGAAIVLEIARTAAAAVKAGTMPAPAWDLRFAVWAGEISSTRQYAAAMAEDESKLQAVFNYDQSGYGSSKDALYVEPDDVEVNRRLVNTVRGVMKDHLESPGFPSRAASVRSQGGTDSYVFQHTRDPAAPTYPAVTIYTSAWDRERSGPLTEGFPPLNWYPEEKPGTVTVDGDDFYHSAGDTPANTTDKEPSNMGWSARVGLLSVLRLMAGTQGGV